MVSRKLSARQLEAIEKRFRAGEVTDKDIEHLIFTVRAFLEEKPRRAESRQPVKPSAESGAAPAVPAVGHGTGTVQVFTDGACEGNPGPGGWGAIVRMNGTEKELSGGERRTTNNRMELSAAIEGLKILPPSSQVVLTTDSQYVQKGITQWIKNWKRNGWINAAKEPVKNADLWRELDALCGEHSVEWRWVRGHAGHAENERCDALAREAIRKAWR